MRIMVEKIGRIEAARVPEQNDPIQESDVQSTDVSPVFVDLFTRIVCLLAKR